ncbi:hypothetical protein [Pseudomonas sp. Hg5Tf]|uniref:Uncharacterized protein n=1 Tax=Pseudomonas sp. Hg7Tf TaxID=3236988 RepID=A0AB39I060_9PSED|nr:hypothetical protein [Pseudomonas sp. Hg5Tf]MDH2558364.1 hypothetical protein [Pseudomonas sp. Hg5Tf]
MAMTPQERDERRREKAALLGEQDLRFKVTTSHASQLADLMAWDEIEESGEALTLMIHQVHAIGRERFLFFAGCAHLEIDSKAVEPINRTELRLMARRGTVDALEEIGAWIGSPGHSFVIRLLVERAHALGPIQALILLSPPARHKFVVSDSVARKLDRFRISRELRTPDLMLGDDPEDTGVLVIENLRSTLPKQHNSDVGSYRAERGMNFPQENATWFAW